MDSPNVEFTPSSLPLGSSLPLRAEADEDIAARHRELSQNRFYPIN